MGEEQILIWLETFSYPAVFVLLLACGMGAPLSEDLIVLCGGILAAKGGAHLPAMMVVAWVGVVAGDSLLYRIGKKLGPKAVAHHRLSKLLTPSRVAWVEGHFARHGVATIFFARFLPGVRAPTFLIAGMGGVPYARFVTADALAAAVIAPTFTFLGYHFGLAALAEIRRASFWLLIAVATGVSIFVGTRWLIRWRKARALERALSP
ncbi:MAG: DedA family protein [Myxococcaceae bacterium]